MNHNLFYKTGKIEREVIKLPPIDICGYINGKSTNPFTKMLIDYFRLYAPQIVRKCPWKGIIAVYNLSLANTQLISLLPSGYYRYSTEYLVCNF